jgi:hypothetical protein
VCEKRRNLQCVIKVVGDQSVFGISFISDFSIDSQTSNERLLQQITSTKSFGWSWLGLYQRFRWLTSDACSCVLGLFAEIISMPG